MTSGGRHWQWYTTERGRTIVREEIDDAFTKLPRPPRVELAELMERIATGQTRRNDAEHVGRGVYEAKLKHQGCEFRLYYSLSSRYGPMLLALKFHKKGGQGAQKREIKKAHTRLADAKRRDIC